jgi:dihydrofolate reductase
MSRLLVRSYTISLDGFGAGPNQSMEAPLGIGGEELHDWLVNTRTFKQMQKQQGGDIGPDEGFAAQGFENIGAWIMGRNMFTASRGPWRDDDTWRGWWGKNPPYHAPTFVLTRYPRPAIHMEGGTVFHFVTGGIEAALEDAKAAAAGRDIRLLGGASTIRQYLQAKLVDEMHFAVSPMLLGSGEHLLSGLDLPSLGYRCSESVGTARATHYVIDRA